MKKGFLLKKMTALILASSMIFSLIPCNGVYAAELDDTNDNSITAETQLDTEETIPDSDTENTEQSDNTETTTEVTTEASSEAITEATTVAEEVTTEEIVTTETTTEDITTEQPTEDTITEDKNPADDNDKKTKDKKSEDKKKDNSSEKKKSTEKSSGDKGSDTTEVEIEPEIIPTFNQIYEGVSISGIDFSSCELLISTSDPSIFTQDTEVVSEYKGIYLTRYPDAEQTKSAYTYYYNKSDFIDVNSTIRANDKESEGKSSDNSSENNDSSDDEADPDDTAIPNNGHGEADMSELNNSDDALSNLNEKTASDYSGCIALIDSGASGSNVIGSVTVLGGTTSDDNGHGTKLAAAIAETNPSAKILSIKVLGSDASGTVADVYAGIQYAIKANVSVINLSMSSVDTTDSDVLSQAIAEAQAVGIKVVSSAGNNGKAASYYIPGNIAGVITIGACNENGNRISSSNYGTSVNYYVTADSTSVAAAKFSAILLNNELENISEIDNIFTREYVEDYDKEADIHTTTDATSDIHTITDATPNDSEEKTEISNPEHKNEIKKDFDDYHNLFKRLVAAAPANYPNQISINFDIDDAIPSRVIPPSYYHVTGGAYSNGECTAFNWTVNSWSIVDNGFNKDDFEFSQGGEAYCNEKNKESSVSSYGNTATLTYNADYSDGYWYGYIAEDVSVNQPSWTNKAVQKVNIMVFIHRETVEGGVGRFTLEKKVKQHNLKNEVSMDGVKYTITITSQGTAVATIEAEMAKNGRIKNSSTITNNNHPKIQSVKIVKHNDQNYIEIKAKDDAEPITKVKIEFKEKSVPSGSPLILNTATKTDTLDFNGKWKKYTVAEAPNVLGDGTYWSNWGTIFINKVSSNPTTKSLAGAEYAIFTNKTDADSANVSNYTSKSSYVRSVITDANGNGYAQVKFNSNNHGDMSVGKYYYVKEVKGPAVGGFELDTTVYSQYVNHAKNLYIRQEGNTWVDYSLVFNGEWYKAHNTSDSALQSLTNAEDMFAHFINHGMAAEQQASPFFNPASYKQKAGKGSLSGKNIYLDYMKNGVSAGIAGLSSDEIETLSNDSRFECYAVFKSTDKETPVSVKVNKSVAASYINYVKNNPNYSLNGVKFQLYKDAAYTDYVGDITLTESNGTITSSTLIIPNEKMNKNADNTYKPTDFYWKETGGKGYKNVAGILEKVDGSLNVYPIIAINTPGTDPLNISLYKEGQSGNPTGGQSLAGAEFTVKFYAQDITKDFDSSKNPDKIWTFATQYRELTKKYVLQFNKSFKVSGSDDWFDSTGQLELPYGYFTIQETKAPDGYEKTGTFIGKDSTGATVNTAGVDGVLVLTSDSTGTTGKTAEGVYKKINSLTMTDEEIRADLDITKVDEDGKPLAGVEFKVTRVDDSGKTLQSVILVTDENGFVSTESSYASHLTDTNSGKAYAGTWFGELGTDGMVLAEKISDDSGALPVGTYKVKELRCAANKGKQLEVFDDIIVKAGDNDKIFHLFDSNASEADGKVWNYKNPIIKTTARVIETDSKTLAQVGSDIDSTNQTIEDTVSYDRLRRDTEYTVLTELMVVDKYNNVTLYTDKSGNTRRQIKAFKTEVDYKKSRYEITASQKVDITGVDPAGYEEEQKKFVVYQTLFLGTYNSLEELDQAIADKSYKTRYDEFDEEDSMDFFPVEHKQADDENQTVRPGDIHTTIKDSVSESRIAMPGTKSSHVDTSYYTGLTPGKEATVVGTIQVKEGSDWSKITYDPKNPAADKDGFVYSTENSGENKIYTLRDANGNPVTASTTFIPKTSSGYVDLTFNFDSSLLAGKSIVAFEQLMYNGKVIMVHANPMDEDETIHYPEIKTSTRNALIKPSQITEENKYSAKEVLAADGQSFIDTVHSINLIANNTFRFKGTLVDSSTGEVLKDASGKEIKATKDFTTDDIKEVEVTKSPDAFNYTTADGTLLDMAADHANYMYTGDIDVEFTGYDFSNLAAVRGTVFEEVYLVKDGKEILIGEHKDLNDVEQFVRFIKIQTSAKDILTDSRILPLNVETTVEDEVTYEGLLPGSKYSFTTTLVVSNDKSGKYKDGEELKVNGKPVEVKYSFIPKTANGVEKVRIKVNTTNFTTRDITIFEELKNSFGLTIAFHKDLKDKNQTLHVPDIGTKATVNGAKSITTDGKVTIDDEVDITNLVVEKGTKATLKGILMDKATGKELKINGKTVTQEKTFEVNDANESQHLKFSFTAKNFSGDVVVYERLYINGVEVASETDINNEDQTINITPPTPPSTPPTTPPSKPPVKTGDSIPVIPAVIILAGSLVGIVGIVFSKRKKKNSDK